MIAFLSPAKNMRPAPAPGVPLTRPVFQREADRLAALLRGYSPWELESLLQINPSLAMKAAGYYQDFAEAPASAALSAYYGLAFQHLDAASLTPEDYAWAGEHLRILSALYGVLRPADGIRPYRLELQCCPTGGREISVSPANSPSSVGANAPPWPPAPKWRGERWLAFSSKTAWSGPPICRPSSGMATPSPPPCRTKPVMFSCKRPFDRILQGIWNDFNTICKIKSNTRAGCPSLSPPSVLGAGGGGQVFLTRACPAA